MTEKHFKAILAKNNIAKEIFENESESISRKWIMSNLRDIEAYIGEGNQPSIDDIISLDK